MEELQKNDIVVAGFFGGGSKPRNPREAPEGIITGTERVLAKTQINTFDLLSEGKIQGLVTGKYNNSGVLGHIGWSGVNFIPNPIANTGNNSNIRWLQSVYWNETPVVDDNGQFNFQQVAVSYTKGSPNGSNISDNFIDELTSTRLIGERLRGGGDIFFKLYRILNRDCVGVEVNIRIGSFSSSVVSGKKTGDTNITSIDYTIYYRPIFSDKDGGVFIIGKTENITGKTSSGYIRNSRINFNSDYSNDENFLGWEIKIIRWTQDSTTIAVRNQTSVDSLTEIYGNKFIYPNSAIVSSLFDAEYFSSVPARTFETELLQVKVPSNYDPIRKTYDESSPWDLTFKTDNDGKILKQWTDNPAWCYYDLLTNRRYGLGTYIDEDLIDKATLYEISKYCDTLVSDGYGGLEPRFTCNLYITSQDEAYKVLNSIASIFRGITYYSAGQIYTSQDVEKSPVYQFTNANAVDGDFNYSSSSKKARHTIAIVRYNDKRNFYKPTLEYVEDVDSIRKYGLRDVEVAAFGCVSRGQAIRLGRWALLTESLETEVISFRAGLESTFLRPGDVFQIYDANRKSQRLGGRLSNIIATSSSTNLTLDSQLPILDNTTTYKLSLLTPTYYYDSAIVNGLDSSDVSGVRHSQLQYLTFNSSNVTNVSGRSNLSIPVTINNSLDYTNYSISGNNIWLIEATGTPIIGNIQNKEWDNYRVINVKETDSHVYEIEGLQYDISKFLQIESGFNFADSPNSPSLSFASPVGLLLNVQQITDHSKLINYSFSVPSLANIRNFRVFEKELPFVLGDQNSGNLVMAELPTSTLSGSFLPESDGTYYFRVYSLGNNGALSSSYAENSISISNINPIQDFTVSSLQLDSDASITNASGTLSTGIYSTDSPLFEWQAGIEGISNLPTDLTYRITVRSPSPNNTPSNEIYFEQTGYTTSHSNYQFLFDDNYNSLSNLNRPGPFREYDIVVEGMTSGGYSSAGGNFITNSDSTYNNPNGYDILYVNNPKPSSRSLFTGGTDYIVPGTTLPFYSTGYATQQWITSDGEIKMFFSVSGQISSLSGFFGDDIAGGTLYYSNVSFLPEEATQQISTTKTINNVQIASDNNPVIAPVGLFNATSQYIAIAPFDTFDLATNSKINNYLVTGLNISNVVSISSRISPSFTTPDIPLVQGALLYRQPHTFSHQPRQIDWKLTCQISDVNWQPGEQIDVESCGSAILTRIFIPFADDTYMGLIMGVVHPYIAARSTAGAYSVSEYYPMNINNWTAIGYADL